MEAGRQSDRKAQVGVHGDVGAGGRRVIIAKCEAVYIHPEFGEKIARKPHVERPLQTSPKRQSVRWPVAG